LRQTNLFRYPNRSGPAGILFVPQSLQHANLTTFHLNNFVDTLKHF